MDLDKLFQAFEKYSQEFIIYLLSFFKDGNDSRTEQFTDTKNKVLLFSLMSAFLGSYLISRYGQGAILQRSDLFNRAVNEELWWTGAGAFMYFVMSRFPPQVSVMEPMLVVFKVLPVAWIACGFTTYVIYSVFDFIPNLTSFAYIMATLSSALVYAAMSVLFLRRSFPPPTTKSPTTRKQVDTQRNIGVAATIGLILVIIAGREAGWTIRNWASIVNDGAWLGDWGRWLVNWVLWAGRDLAYLVGKAI